MNIGEKIRLARIQKHLTRKGLAERIGVAENSVRRYEIGEFNPPIEKLVEIARELGVTTDWLLRDEGTILDGESKTELFAEDYMDAHNAIGKAIDHWHEIGNRIIIEDKEITMVNIDERVMLLAAYYKLNDLGKSEALKRLEEMGEISKYKAATAE